jgi:hypothetical protein
MSEKRYIIVSPSHHKKPRAMFLSEPADKSKSPQWNYHTTYALLLTKAQVNRICGDTLVSIIAIEYNDDIKDLARTGETKFIDYVNKVEEVRNTSRFFTADGLKVLIVNTMRKVRKELPTKPQTQAAPEVSRSFIADELIVRGQGKHKIEIWDESSDEAKPEPTPKERCYALYSKSADGKVKYFCGENAQTVALHKNQRVQIFTQSEAHDLQHLPYTDEADADVLHVENIAVWNLGEQQETPEEKREYVLYRYLGDTGVKQFYFSYREKDCYSKNLDTATLYTEDEAMLQVNRLAHAGSKGWFCVHRDAFSFDGSFKEAAKETLEASPVPKKRVGYVLFGELLGAGIVYRNQTDIFVNINEDRADVYMTNEQADFIAYTLNNSDNEFFTWQVKQVEF